MISADDGAVQLADGAQQLTSGAQSAVDGIAQLKDGSAQLADGSASLLSGASELYFGIVSADDGAVQLADGAAQLKDGVAQVDDGVAQLVDGNQQLYDGSAELADGLTEAHDGSVELADGLAVAKESLVAMDQDEIDARSSMMSSPVELVSENYTTVANYGTGFTPYFVALGLWVGALMLTFLVRPLNNRLIASGANHFIAAFCGYVPMLIMGTAQALLLCVVIQFVLKIDIQHPVEFYLFSILIAWSFCALMQLFIAAFGFSGKFVAIIFLMLQLTSAAGTFPIETSPEFFQVISPFMPMTYAVDGLKAIISGISLAPVAGDVAFLVGVIVVSFTITSFVARHRRTVTLGRLHPLIDL
jgi:putative membrane protein